jgi:hypothetical protein
MRNLLLIALTLLSLAFAVSEVNNFFATHKEECRTYVRHALTYKTCKWVKKGGEDK